LDGVALSFDRIVERDRELAVCLFLIYAAVPMAVLKLGNASRPLEAAAKALQELLKVGTAKVIPIRSLS
jgi:hypothetical protein